MRHKRIREKIGFAALFFALGILSSYILPSFFLVFAEAALLAISSFLLFFKPR